MKKLVIFMLMTGLVALAGCSSNDANVKADDSVSDMKNEQSADAVKEVSKVEQKEPVMTETMPAKTEGSASMSTGKNKISVCKNAGQVRIISVVYKQGESSTSCEVTYEKSTGVKSLWNAKTDLSYCENKAREFVKRQEGWGWVCTALE